MIPPFRWWVLATPKCHSQVFYKVSPFSLTFRHRCIIKTEANPFPFGKLQSFLLLIPLYQTFKIITCF